MSFDEVPGALPQAGTHGVEYGLTLDYALGEGISKHVKRVYPPDILDQAVTELFTNRLENHNKGLLRGNLGIFSYDIVVHRFSIYAKLNMNWPVTV